MLALISGTGQLPAAVAHAQAQTPIVCVLDGFAPDQLPADVTFRLEHLGSLLAALKEKGVTEVCFCGAIERPPFDPSKLDQATLPLVPIMMKAMGSGDDGALRAVIALFEQQGFVVRAAHELAPGLLAPPGVLSTAQPDDDMRRNVERADAVLDALSPLDVGQGCVVGAGQVLGIETIGGTDHMLSTLPKAVRNSKSVLVKHPKHGQDLRADMPTIGPDTVQTAVAAGLAGIVIEAGSVLMLEQAEIVSQADAAGLVLWSRAGG